MQPEREWLVDRFRLNLSQQNLDNLSSILVLGGGINEPELMAINFPNMLVHFAGIDRESITSNFYYLDLNVISETLEKFDLVICNQVLEHLHNPQAAFSNISKLVRNEGFVWLTLPSSNFRHGSPEYYSSGYSREFISKNMITNGFDVLDVGELSNKRIYLYRHILEIWPSWRQIRFPMFAYFGREGSTYQKLMFNLCSFFPRILLTFSSSKMSTNGGYSIETFGFFGKSKDRLG
jgi:SAM-dependent methyltransferase